MVAVQQNESTTSSSVTTTTKKMSRDTTGVIEMYNGTTDGEVPWIGEGAETNMAPHLVLNVKVQDIRGLENPLSIKKEGVELYTYPTKFTTEQFHASTTEAGNKVIETEYFEEVRQLVQGKTEADEVVPFHYGFRVDVSSNVPKDAYINYSKTGLRGPSIVMHVDKTPEIARRQLKEMLGEDKFNKIMATYKRVHIINTWRPVSHEIERYPLILVNTDKLSEFTYETNFAKLAQKNFRGGHKPYQIALKHDPDYEYQYASNMTPDEVVMFRDCDLHGIHRGQAHGSFFDDNTRSDAPGRVSIEVRCLVCYKD